LTDTHIFADPNETFGGASTLKTLQAVIRQARDRHWPADAVVVTGDLVNDPDPGAYRILRQCLRELTVPVYCIPGNHDDPGMMDLALTGDNIQRVDAVGIGPWRLVFVNTCDPGNPSGHITDPGLDTLEASLLVSGDQPVLVFLHHHPVPIGSSWMDKMMLENPQDFFHILDRCPNVKGVFWGHIHQEFHTVRHGARLFGAPSTCIQFQPGADSYLPSPLGPGYRWLELHPDGNFETGVSYLDAPPDRGDKPVTPAPP
jgi:Icc protein